jgi:hypothetical protein
MSVEQLTIAIEEQPDHAAQLQGELLTVGFQCALTPVEKRKKLRRAKVRQLGLGLEAENEEELNGWFALVDFGGLEVR